MTAWTLTQGEGQLFGIVALAILAAVVLSMAWLRKPEKLKREPTARERRDAFLRVRQCQYRDPTDGNKSFPDT